MHVLKGAARRAFFAVALVSIALPLASGGLASTLTGNVATPASAQTVTGKSYQSSYFSTDSTSQTAPVSCTAPGQVDCYYSATPALAFNFLGQAHTETFTCGEGVGYPTYYPGLAGLPASEGGRPAEPFDLNGGDANAGTTLSPGCYDVTASVNDESTGDAVSITSSECGYNPAGPSGSTVNCAAYASPLCAYGATSSAAAACDTVDTDQELGSKMKITFNPGAPHAYLITFTGYTLLEGYCTSPPSTAVPEATGTGNPGDRGTCYTATGTAPACPVGATYISGGPLGFALHTSIGVPPVTSTVAAPDGVCKFTVQAEKKYIEVTTVTEKKNCSGTLTFIEGEKAFFGPACTISAVAAGTVILKTGVDCTHEPNGTTAPGFPAGSTYACTNGTLSVTIPNVLAPNPGAVGPGGLTFHFTITGPGGPPTSVGVVGGLCTGRTGVTTVTATSHFTLCPTGPGSGTVIACAFIANSIDTQPAACSTAITFTFTLPPSTRVVPYVRWAGEKQVLTKCFGPGLSDLPVQFTLSAGQNDPAGAVLLAPVDTAGESGTFFPNGSSNGQSVWVETDDGGCASVVVFASGEGQVVVDATIYARTGVCDLSAAIRPHQTTGCGPLAIINEHVFEIFYLKFDHIDLENIKMTSYSSSTFSSPVNSLGFTAASAFGSDAIPGAIPSTFSLPNAPGTNPAGAGGVYPIPLCGTDLVRAMVHGYLEIPGDPSGRPAAPVTITGAPSNAAGSYVLPAGRWVLPEDWPVLATFAGFTNGSPNEGGFSAANGPTPPSSVFAWDLNSGWAFNPGNEAADVCVGAASGTAPNGANSTGSITDFNTGPCYGTDVTGTAYQSAPSANCGGITVGFDEFDATEACTTPYPLAYSPAGSAFSALVGFGPLTGNSTYLPNGTLNEWDAPMPAAQVQIGITSGPGFLDQVDKTGLYQIGLLGSNGKPNGNAIFPDPFYSTAIPASPLIPPIINDGGYLWDTWGFYSTAATVEHVTGTAFVPGTTPTSFAQDACSEETLANNTGGNEGQGWTYDATGPDGPACYEGPPDSHTPDTVTAADCPTGSGTAGGATFDSTNSVCYTAPAPPGTDAGQAGYILTNLGTDCPVGTTTAGTPFPSSGNSVEVANINDFAVGESVEIWDTKSHTLLAGDFTITAVTPGPDANDSIYPAPPTGDGQADTGPNGAPGTITFGSTVSGCYPIYAAQIIGTVVAVPTDSPAPPVGTSTFVSQPNGRTATLTTDDCQGLGNANTFCYNTGAVTTLCGVAAPSFNPANCFMVGTTITFFPGRASVPVTGAPAGGMGPYPFWQWVPNAAGAGIPNTAATVYSDNHGESVVSLETGIAATAAPVNGVCPTGFIPNATPATLCFLDLATLGTSKNAAGVAFGNIAAATGAFSATTPGCVSTTASGGLGPAPTGTPVVGATGPAAGQICINTAGGIEFGAGATLGSTTLQAVADYPYVRGLHAPIASPSITKVFTSAFAKTLTVTPISPAAGCTPGTTGCGIVGPAGTTAFTVTITGTDICGNPLVGEPVNVFALGNAGAVVLAGTGPGATPNGTNASTVILNANGTATLSLEVLNTAIGTGGLVIKAVFPLEKVERLVTVIPGTTPGQTTTQVYPPGYNQIGGPPGSNFGSAEALFSYNPATGAYVNATAVATNLSSAPPACTGYWAYFASATAVVLPVTSHPGDTATCTLQAGWNLIGNPFGSAATIQSGVTAYHYNGTGYDVVSAIPVGGAVWIFSAAAGTVTLTAQ